jgi:hypothetical protein
MSSKKISRIELLTVRMGSTWRMKRKKSFRRSQQLTIETLLSKTIYKWI